MSTNECDFIFCFLTDKIDFSSNIYCYFCPMYFDPEGEFVSKPGDQTKTIYIYENSCNNKHPVVYKIRNQFNVFKDIAEIFKFRKLRLFNQEGAEYFEDDLRFVKNKTSLYASKGEQFDPHNCFGQYEIVKKLGQGGFGEVFLANHKHSGEKCAIKIIKISSVSDIDSIFVEAEILKSLKHENIVKVTNCLTFKNMQVAIIMEYLQGGQLLQYVQNQGRLDQETAKTFCRQIVKGIMYCHENNLIHRDLKLQNVLLVNSEEKKVKIIDFGIAGVMNRLTQQDLDAGSLGYMAPECFDINLVSNENNFKFDGKMDVWAIGVILYSMLCAELPFKGNNNYEIKENIKKGCYKLPLQVRKSLSKQCLNAVYRCLDPNPKTRIKIGELMVHEWFLGKSKFDVLQEKPIAPNTNQINNYIPDNLTSSSHSIKNKGDVPIGKKEKRVSVSGMKQQLEDIPKVIKKTQISIKNKQSPFNSPFLKNKKAGRTSTKQNSLNVTRYK